MKKILSINIIDIIPYSQGLLFVRKEVLEDDNIKVTFFSYDIDTDKITPVTKSVYLLNKFGPSFAPIAQQLGDYVSCDTGKLPGGNIFIIYSTGEVGLFDNNGELSWTGDLFYHDAPARDVAVENKHIWCVVPSMNSVIRYSVAANKVVMRIGGNNSSTFSAPESVCEYDGKLFVCNRDSMKINTVDLMKFSVADYMQFDEPVHKYLRVADREFVVLNSGVYML